MFDTHEITTSDVEQILDENTTVTGAMRRLTATVAAMWDRRDGQSYSTIGLPEQPFVGGGVA